MILFLLLAAAAGGHVFAGPGIWTSSGPNGGRVNALVASPFNASEFYAVSRSGVFKSVDGGVTWTDASAGINRAVFSIAHSGTGANRLMVNGSRKLFYSDDGAATWQDRTPPAGLVAGATLGQIAASPVLPGTYYVVVNDGRILITDDAGLSWRSSPTIVQPDPFAISAIAADPAAPGEVLVATDTGFSVIDHRLWRGNLNLPAPPTVWTGVPCPAGCPWETSSLLDIEFGAAGRVWSVSQSGAARSDDSGATWVTPPGGAGLFGQSISIRPGDNSELYIAGGTGLLYTTDDGATFTQVLGGFAGNAQLQPAQSTVVAHDPFNPSLQLAGSISNGVYRRIALPPVDSFVPGVDGFNAQNIRAVASNTLDRVHVGVSDSFGATFVSFRSVNNGLTWSQANGGLAADQFRAMVVDPNDSEVIYAGGRYDPKADNTGVTVPGNGGLYKSTNGGINWTTIDSGIPLTPAPFAFSLFGTVRDIAVDPNSADPVTGESQTLYATGTGRFTPDGMGGFTQEAARVYKSTDAGATWVASDTGIGGVETGVSGINMFASGVQIIVDPTDATGQTLYMATFMSRDESDVPTTIDNGIFKSIDGGANWTNITNGLPRIDGNPAAAATDALSLAFDPTDATGQTLYASTNDLSNSVLGTVYKTIDGGANWAFAGTGLENRDVRDLSVDPLTGDVYAAVADPLGNGDGGVFVSEDGGASWASISTGFPGAAVALKLELDNTGANLLLHAGTTRGVQSFEVLPDEDTDGATDDTEDAAPPAARGGLPAGDGNGDGVRDAIQTDVASPQVLTATRGTPVTITATVEPAFSGAGACDRFENSFGLNLLQGVPEEQIYEAIFNGLHLRIPDCDAARVTVIYHGRDFVGDPTWQIRGYGLDFPDEETNRWFRLDTASVTGNAWTFDLTDGAAGDATPDDGIIVFQGGAKRLVERFFADGMEAE